MKRLRNSKEYMIFDKKIDEVNDVVIRIKKIQSMHSIRMILFRLNHSLDDTELLRIVKNLFSQATELDVYDGFEAFIRQYRSSIICYDRQISDLDVKVEKTKKGYKIRLSIILVGGQRGDIVISAEI